MSDQENNLVEKLQRCKILERDYLRLLEEYREMLPSGTRSMMAPVMGGSRTYGPEAWAAKRIRCSLLIDDKKAELSKAVQEFKRLLLTAPASARECLVDRYIRSMTWNDIGKKNNCDRQTAKNRHDRAIRQIMKGIGA